MNKYLYIIFLTVVCYLCLVLFSPIAWSQNKANQDSFVSSKSVYRLACQLYDPVNGNYLMEAILTIDEVNSLLNGRPAKYFESEIVEVNNNFTSTLNRYTATMTITENGLPVAIGKCSKINERKF